MQLDVKLFGRVIGMLRKSLGWSQKELSAKTLLKTIPQIEQGKKGVSLQSLDTIASSFQIPTSSLTILATAFANDELMDEMVKLQARMTLNAFADVHEFDQTRRKKLFSEYEGLLGSSGVVKKPQKREPVPA